MDHLANRCRHWRSSNALQPINAAQEAQRNKIAMALANIQRPPPRMGGPGGGGMRPMGPPPGMVSAAPGGGLTPPGSNVGVPAPMTGVGAAMGATGAPGGAPMMPGGGSPGLGGAMPPGMGGGAPPGAPGSMAPIPQTPMMGPQGMTPEQMQQMQPGGCRRGIDMGGKPEAPTPPNPAGDGGGEHVHQCGNGGGQCDARITPDRSPRSVRCAMTRLTRSTGRIHILDLIWRSRGLPRRSYSRRSSRRLPIKIRRRNSIWPAWPMPQSQRLGEHLAAPFSLAGAPAAGNMDLFNQFQNAHRNDQLQHAGADDIWRGRSRSPAIMGRRRATAPIGSGSSRRYMGGLIRSCSVSAETSSSGWPIRGSDMGSQAYTSAMDDYNRQANDARLAVTQVGGQEQQRLNDMAAQRAGFQNAAQQQAYSQELGRGQFYNAAQRDMFQSGRLQIAVYSMRRRRRISQQNQSAFNAQNMLRNQYIAEQYALRNQPINEISSLLSGSQVTNPNFLNTPNNQIANTDVAGIINNRFNQDMSIYQQQSQQYNQLMGGIFGMMGGMMRMSDERMKDVGPKLGTVFAADPHEDERALPIYAYTYKGDPTKTPQAGPMAQDVEKINAAR